VKLPALLLAIGIAFSANAALAGGLSIDLEPDAGNPASPQMGDTISYHTAMRNEGSVPVDGLIAWISLIQIDKDREQPVDLEDWSAHKAVTAATLDPGRSLETNWPIRLIQAGTYRVVVSAVNRNGTGLTASRFADFTVRKKPVVESQRVFPVALGLPLLIAGVIVWRRRRG
jgi:hypothetical protein